MIIPAVNAAALEPNPLPNGMWFEMTIEIGGSGLPASFATRKAVCQIRFDSSRGMASASKPSHSIRSSADRSKVQIRNRFNASPSASKPGPKLALEAGTHSRYFM